MGLDCRPEGYRLIQAKVIAFKIPLLHRQVKRGHDKPLLIALNRG